MALEEIDELKKSMMLTELIGLGETQRKIYENLNPTGDLQSAYKLHQKELAILIKCQDGIKR